MNPFHGIDKSTVLQEVCTIDFKHFFGEVAQFPFLGFNVGKSIILKILANLRCRSRENYQHAL